MNPSESLVRVAVVSLLLLALSGVSAQSVGMSQQSAVTVQDLLQAEMSKQPQRVGHVSVSQPHSIPRLIGMWGVHPRLFAQVSHDGQVIEFQSGRVRALAPNQQMYGLIAIDPPCIRFKARQRVVKLCHASGR